MSKNLDLALEYVDKAEKLAKQESFSEAVTNYNLANEIFFTEKKWNDYVNILCKISELHLKKREFSTALKILEKGFEIADKYLDKNSKETGYLYKSKGEALYYSGKPKESLEWLTKALEIWKNYYGEGDFEYADILGNIGTSYQGVGDLDNALKYLNKSENIMRNLPERNSVNYIKILSNIANIQTVNRKYDVAKPLFKKAIDILIPLKGEEYHALANIYNGLGIIYFQKGEYDDAILYLNNAANIWIKNFGETYFQLGTYHHNIAIIYYLKKEIDLALEHFKEALSFVEKDSLNYATISTHIGIIYGAKKDFKTAIEYEQTALDIYLKLNNGNKNNTYIAEIYKNMGAILGDEGKFDEATKNFKEAISIWSKILSEKHSYVASVYVNMGKMYLYANLYDKALIYLQKALIANAENFNATDYAKNPEVNDIISFNDGDEILLKKGDALYQLYLQNNDIENLINSYNTYRRFIELFEKMRTDFISEETKLYHTEQTFQIFVKIIDIALELYKITNENDFLIQTFEYAEKSKAGILNKAILMTKVKNFFDIPSEIRVKENKLKKDISTLKTNIQKEKFIKGQKNNDIIKKLEKDFFIKKREYGNFIDIIRNKYPKYYQMKYQTKMKSLNEIQDILKMNELIVEYVISENKLFMLAISHEDFSIKKVDINKEFYEVLNNYSKLIGKKTIIKTKNRENFNKDSFYLYQTLIAPLQEMLKNKKHLIFIPDGILHHLPFETLIQTDKDYQNFTEPDYLIKDYAISYHYSANLLLETLSQDNQKNRSFVGFAPVFDPNVGNGLLSEESNILKTEGNTALRSVDRANNCFVPLPETEKEVKTIVNEFKKKQLPAKAYFYTEATKENFVKNSNYNFVHTATHSIFNEENPALSGIVFSQPDDKNEDNEGILYAGEIYNLDMQSDLLVLSSCESGLGKIVKGEGSIAITRGFLYAGVKNIIYSLWKVSDRQTSELMIELYKNILEGKGYSQALRDAKLTLLQDEDLSSPNFWSAFLLIGK